MSVMDNLGQVLAPHAARLNERLDFHGNLLHLRLRRIENGISDLGRPSLGDKYFNFASTSKFPSGKTDLFVVRMNEIYPLQFITLNGLVKKTPAFTIEANGITILAFNKEGVGVETIGGDIVLLPGERVSINMVEEGTVELTLGMIRVPVTIESQSVDYGPSQELLAGTNTHDPNRDVIASPDGLYESDPPEIVNSAGRPPIALNGSGS